MNSFECPACRGNIGYEPEDEGKKVGCPHCAQPARVPVISCPKVTTPPNSQRRECRVCQGVVSANAYACPHCGEPYRSQIPTMYEILALIYIIIGAILLLGFGWLTLNYLSRLPTS